MENNFKKIIIGLLMLSSFTGCSNLNNSTFNTENLSSKISDLLNNSTDHKHSSSSSLSDKITSTSTTNSSNDKTSSSSSSSSSNSSSNSSSSSSGDIIEDVIDSNEVSKDTWESALSIDSLSNVTINEYIFASLLYEDMPSYIRIEGSIHEKVEIADIYSHNIYDQLTEMVIDKAALMEDMQLTDEQAEMVIDQLALQYGREAIKEGENYIITMNNGTMWDYYLEKETDETVFQYDYSDYLYRYEKTRELGSFKEMAFEGRELLDVSFDNAVYDQNKKAYYIDGTNNHNFILRPLGILHLDYVEMYYYFSGDKLAKISITGAIEDDGAATITFNAYFKEYGTTTVTLPSQNMIVSCDHLDSSYQRFNDTYHFNICHECQGILEYEKHEFGTHDCPECGYVPTSKELITVDGLDEKIKLYKATNILDNELYEIYFEFEGNYASYHGEIFDPETGEVIGEEIGNGAVPYIIKALWEDEKVDGECLVNRTITYNFLDENTYEPVCEPIVIETKRVKHNYIEGETIVEGCKIIHTEVCTDCSKVVLDIDYSHEQGDVIYGEEDDNCHAIKYECCKNCEHKEYSSETRHELTFTILDKDNCIGKITCSKCGLEEVGSYDCYTYDDLLHKYYFETFTTTNYGYYYFYAEHEFVDGHCECGYVYSE